MSKITLLCVIILLSSLMIGCTKQISCYSTIKSIIDDNKVVNDSISKDFIANRNFTIMSSIYPKFSEGNGGINPPISYFAKGANEEWYYVNGGLYTQVWHGPYTGNLPAQCLFPGK